MNEAQEQNTPTPTREAAPLGGYDPLLAFAHWYVRQHGFVVPRSQFDGVSRVGAFSGLVLYRQPPYKVQLWICDPSSEIPDHRHPNVDSLLIYISGQFWLRVNGERVFTPEQIKLDPDGAVNANGTAQRVRPADLHGATIGPKGGAFINIQHWLAGEPQSVEIDWIGEPLCEEHALRIRKTA